ncbi:hypothetical protein C0995_004301 [Termitomyces sp. Mi166|nr:hypothetical protein C0995_004301 [Termitomyces sp. Mi166\
MFKRKHPQLDVPPTPLLQNLLPPIQTINIGIIWKQLQLSFEVSTPLENSLNKQQCVKTWNQPPDAPPILVPPSQHSASQAPSAPIKEDVCSEHTLSYVNEPDVGAALEQAQPELE